MEYSIQALSRLSGVTTRTLRWYDQIGLLKPARVAETGYRYYGPAEVDRLHAFRMQPHDGEPVKAEQAVSGIQDARVIRSARDGRGKSLLKARAVSPSAEISHDRTHCHSPLSDHR